MLKIKEDYQHLFFFDPGFDCVIEVGTACKEDKLFIDPDSPWSKPFKYGDYIHMKVKNNFPELAKQNHNESSQPVSLSVYNS